MTALMEARFASAWQRMAKAEGHAPKLPHSVKPTIKGACLVCDKTIYSGIGVCRAHRHAPGLCRCKMCKRRSSE